jgi:DNA-binding CsgD family transcriptional regulator
MTTSAERLSELIHAIYFAAEEAERWPLFLEMLAEEVSCGMTVLLALDWKDSRANVASSVRADPEAITLYNARWASHDPWVASGHESLRTGGAVVFSEEMVSDRNLEKTAFFNDFAKHFDMFHTLSATIIANPDMSAGLSCHYPKGAAIEPTSRELLRMLVPHLEQALRFHRRWQRDRVDSAVGRELVARSGNGFVLLDGRGRILHANPVAEGVLKRGDGLRSRGERLSAVYPADEAELRAAIAAAAQTALGSAAASGATLAIRRTSLRRPYALTIVPVSGAGALFGRHGAAVMLMLTDPDGGPSVDATLLRKTFGWTAAETEVALLILAGRRPQEIARSRRVSAATVRTQLKNIFQKADVSTQSDLVRVMLGGGSRRSGEAVANGPGHHPVG